MKTIRTISLTLLLLLGIACSILPARASAFDPFGNLKQNVCREGVAGSDHTNASNSEVCTKNQTDNPISGTNGILLKATDILSYVAGIAAVIVIIVGGFQYALSGGDSSKVNSAKNMILYAVIGLVVIILGRSIIAFAINRL
jgi:hypothetical protein